MAGVKVTVTQRSTGSKTTLAPDATAGLPPDLATAIKNASAQYGVPVDVMVGMWRKETGSKFPNPYMNGWGYGGEFGTRMGPAFSSDPHAVRRIVEPPVQQQAYESASILSRLIRQYGSLADALYHYSGKGYTSVPGQTTPGSFTLSPGSPIPGLQPSPANPVAFINVPPGALAGGAASAYPTIQASTSGTGTGSGTGSAAQPDPGQAGFGGSLRILLIRTLEIVVGVILAAIALGGLTRWLSGGTGMNLMGMTAALL